MSKSQAARKLEEFERLFESYCRPVNRYFARRGCSREECQDLTQDTFMGVYKGMGSYRNESSIETWLFVIAANIWRNWLRSKSAQKRAAAEVSLDVPGSREDQGLLGILKSADTGALQKLLSTESFRALREELEDFPPRMRFCFLLRFHSGLKYKEIATIMEISVETVKSQLFQARMRLKENLGDHFSEG